MDHAQTQPQDQFDVFVDGAGPAGLMAAEQAARARGGHRLEDQVQKRVIRRSSTSVCLAECLAEKNKKLRPLSLSLCMSGEP